MIVIADTSPLHYFILLEHAEVMQELYGRVIIPEAVIFELEPGECCKSRTLKNRRVRHPQSPLVHPPASCLLHQLAGVGHVKKSGAQGLVTRHRPPGH